jgi:tRNA-Thr(GGU) m(6)t(6)A37 methyltransferase TsaA
MPVTFDPIGTIRKENGRSYIAFDKKYVDAMLGLDAFSHILVIWWFNLYDSTESRNYFVLDKPYQKGPDKLGVFATRSPIRPNPIAVTACGLVGVDQEECRLEISYTDAEDGTPVLDIKPYEPSIDRVRDALMPLWCAHWPDCFEENENFDWSEEFTVPD